MASNEAVDGDARVCVEMPHLQQRFHWDCGLACARMVLSYFGRSLDNFQERCAQLGFGNSVWTIDVAHLLHAYGIAFTYTTVTLGVDKGYSNQRFYKDKFSADEARVNELFEQAYSQRMRVEKRSVETEEIIAHLQERKPVLLLADWNYLSCKWCDNRLLPNLSCVGRCLGGYQGHYIVLCGYHKTERLFYYHNPALKKTLCCCTLKTLETARKSYGTDEDIIFIHNTLSSDSTTSTQNSTTQQNIHNHQTDMGTAL